MLCWPPARHPQVHDGVFLCAPLIFLLVFIHSAHQCQHFFFFFFCPEGVVPESEVQREAHEAAEHSERPETRVLPRPEADESAGGEAGGGGARPLLLLWR